MMKQHQFLKAQATALRASEQSQQQLFAAFGSGCASAAQLPFLVEVRGHGIMYM